MNSINSIKAVTLQKVSLQRSGGNVLDDISLYLPERRIGLVGRNGSGKSSLMCLLNGLLKPSSGVVAINGIKVDASSNGAVRSVGYIFQNPDHQIVFPTVVEEIAFSLEMSGLDRKSAKSRAASYLDDNGISDWVSRPIHTLSEGQKQWLCIHAVLVTEPDVLVLDEPFSSIDLVNKFRLMRWIAALPQQVFLISHDLDALREFDRIIWLEDGQVRSDGKPSDVLPAYCEESWCLAGTVKF